MKYASKKYEIFEQNWRGMNIISDESRWEGILKRLVPFNATRAVQFLKYLSQEIDLNL